MIKSRKGEWYLVKDNGEEPLGMAYVKEYYDAETEKVHDVGARVIGHQNTRFQPLSEAEHGTYREMGLFPNDLILVDSKVVEIKTNWKKSPNRVQIPARTVVQLAFKVPGEDYPMDGTPLTISGNIRK